MTTPRIATKAQRTIEQAERLAMRLYGSACNEQAKAEANKESEEAKVWWIVRQAAAEAISALKQARGAPDPAFKKCLGPKPRKAPAGPLDHQGIPDKPCV